MKTLLNGVGLDYHEDTIRVCVMTPNGNTLWNRDVPHNARAVRDRVLMFSPPRVVALEACGGVANFAEELRQLTQWDVKLADLARVGHLPVVWPDAKPDAKTRQLRRLVQYRQSLAKARREIKQGIRGVLNNRAGRLNLRLDLSSLLQILPCRANLNRPFRSPTVPPGRPIWSCAMAINGKTCSG